MPSISPKPAATSSAGAFVSTSKSAKIAFGPIERIVFFSPRIMIGAPFELNPSTEGAVGTEIKGMPVV
ncbi:hypothetical protein D3C86_2147380 [compost metagenome]